MASTGRCCSVAPRRLTLSIAIALGLLCHHAIATASLQSAASSLPTASAQPDVWGANGLLSRWREMLTARAGVGEPAPSVFEQAFTATFDSKEPDEVDSTMEQFHALLRWVEANPSPSAEQLAFLPEFRSDTARKVSQAAVLLARGDSKDESSVAAALADITAQLAAASEWRGYPTTRRLLVGSLLKKRLDFGGRFPAKVQAAADDVMLQLFALHKKSAAARGAVQFFHVSKSGGTNLCQSAQANGCASEGFDTHTNCLIRDFSDSPRWVTYNAHKYVQYRMSSRQGLPWFVNFHTFRPAVTCEQRRAYLHSHSFNFYANEYTNPLGAEGSTSEMCEDFVNLIMFRNPNDRLKSQIGWVQKLYKEYYTEVDTRAAFANRTSGFWERLVPAGVNNYYIRSLLGQRFFEYPVNQVTAADTELAKLASLQHDILLVLEDKGRNELAMRVGLGWAQALRDEAVRSSAELGDAVALPLDWDAMLERNGPDGEVYRFAREMQALDAMLWNFVSVADGTVGLANPSSGSCGYVSMGSAEAAARLTERLSHVQLPAVLLRPEGEEQLPLEGAAAATTAAADAAVVPATATAVAVKAAGKGAGAVTVAAAAAKGSSSTHGTGAAVLRGGIAASGGKHGAPVVTIARRSHRRLLWV
ncbi:hypothetical protein TSOC_001063 [Tetrabaena socialis]|uniref:Uncharacterized protein n=1 Tax=Tetrabaena socialis TaxID=47790 RepID=A0A2J8AHP3_9CHLO|nr:hypothetical protein TSOC_001063 [Tetrabaena socialis]|eukprot:PNH12021.1 hypothetical protein TSOC_001063 [Tetrabaena socialis]